jgi:hypothetical protein
MYSSDFLPIMTVEGVNNNCFIEGENFSFPEIPEILLYGKIELLMISKQNFPT